MKYFIRLCLVISFLAFSQLAFSSEIVETFASGDTLTAEKLDAIKTAVNDNNAEIATLRTLVATLQAQIEALQANTVLSTLDGVVSSETVNGLPEVRFTGVNVKIVNGVGSTDSINGVGNLIVGYDEPRSSSSDKTGSHNLISGQEHNYPNYGGFVAGQSNTISGVLSSVSGGENNTASGDGSSISGGVASSATGEASSVTGGFGNTASGRWSSVSGGSGNRATGDRSSVSGGGSRQTVGDLDWKAGDLFENQ